MIWEDALSLYVVALSSEQKVRGTFSYAISTKNPPISFLTFFLIAERGGKFAFFIALTKNSTVYPLQNLFFAELDGGYVLYYIRFFDYAYATLRI